MLPPSLLFSQNSRNPSFSICLQTSMPSSNLPLASKLEKTPNKHLFLPYPDSRLLQIIIEVSFEIKLTSLANFIKHPLVSSTSSYLLHSLIALSGFLTMLLRDG